MGQPLSVFTYHDFQAFLRDWFEHAKKSRKGVSLQSVSASLGLKSKSHLHKILNDAKPTLSKTLAQAFCKLLNLRMREEEYFLALVDFSQATTMVQKNEAYRRMHGILALRDPSPLCPDRFAYFSDWMLPALREVASFPALKGSVEAMGKVFDPPLGTEQVKRGIELLVSLGFLRRNAEGVLEQADPVVDTGDGLVSFAVKNFQLETLDLARKALEQVDFQEREVTTLTFSVPEKAFVRIRDAMRQARDRIVRAILEEDGSADRVFQLNMQLFPITKSIVGKK